MIKKFAPDELPELLNQLTQWQLSADKSAIQRNFKFADFNETFGFMTRVAIKESAGNGLPSRLVECVQ